MESIFIFLKDNFYIIWLVLFIYASVRFLARSLKSRKKFKISDLDIVKFHEKGASGYSNKSFITKIGGANKVLDIIVTEKELWIKGIFSIFTEIGNYYDMSHKIPLSNICKAEINKQYVQLWFINEKGEESNIKLTLRSPNEFIDAIQV